MKKIAFLFGTLLMSIGAFASSEEVLIIKETSNNSSVKNSEKIEVINQVCCTRTGTASVMDDIGFHEVSVTTTACVSSSGNSTVDMNDACRLALSAANRAARRQLQLLLDSL
jgi:hypothetical protein